MSTLPDKPYPRFCAECERECVTPASITYNAEMKHDGRVHQFVVTDLPIDKCEHCGEQWFTSVTDKSLQDALRTHLCLLHPNEVRQKLRDLSLSQTAFANRIGVAPETVSRWMNGRAVQNRAMDNLMRLFLGMNAVRSVLTERGPVEGLGVIERPATKLDWVTEREFPARIQRRRESFHLRILSEHTYAR